MNIPPEMLEIVNRHIGNAIEASVAYEAGLVTLGECLSIINLAVDWCKFVNLCGDPHGPPNS